MSIYGNTGTASPLVNNIAEVKIQMHRKDTNRPWLEKKLLIKTKYGKSFCLRVTSWNHKTRVLVYSCKCAQVWQTWKWNRNFVVFPKTNILMEGKFWFANFTKNCLNWSAKRQSRSANRDWRIADSSPAGVSIYILLKVIQNINTNWYLG